MSMSVHVHARFFKFVEKGSLYQLQISPECKMSMPMAMSMQDFPNLSKKDPCINFKFLPSVKCGVFQVTKIFVITVKGLEHATSCVRDQDATTAPARHI